MPNQFHLRAKIDRLWRRSEAHNPGYIRLAALDAIVCELHAPNDRARANYRLYLATDPYDLARHKLRDLYDQPNKVVPAKAGAQSEGALDSPLPPGEACPALDAGGRGEGPPEEQEPPEDDDPL